MAQRGAIPPPNHQYRGTAKTAKILSRDLFSMRVDKGFHLWNQAKPTLSQNRSVIKYGMMQFSLHHRVAAPPGADATGKRERGADEKGKR